MFLFLIFYSLFFNSLFTFNRDARQLKIKFMENKDKREIKEENRCMRNSKLRK